MLIIAAVALGLYMYNKGPINVKKARAIQIEAALLYTAFEKDTMAANKKFAGKIVQVKGIVKEVSLNQQNEQVILLHTSSSDASINTTMEEANGSVKTGNAINLKGICSGIGEADTDLGLKADVYLTRAYIIE